MKFKRITKFVLLIVIIFFVGGISSIAVDRYVFPKLSTSKFFSKFKIFQKANEGVTIIERTEQVVIKEDDSINQIASQAATTVVNIVSVANIGNLSKAGTGVIMTSDGIIATYRNAIIEEESKYKILIFNGQAYDAELIGIDEYCNLAFLKVDESNLPVIPFANSEDSRPGKKLIAIGSSFGEYQNRFAAGLLSNVNRIFNLSGKTLSSSEKLEGVFETDFNNQQAYIGGPMINYSGELVGIIGSFKLDNKDVNFQIPSNDVKNSLFLAIEEKLETRAVLGVYYLPITKAYSVANDIRRDKGAIIYSSSGIQGLAVISGSPADEAGLRINDIVIAINGNEVNLDNPLSGILSNHFQGEEIELTVDRLGEEIKIKVQL